MLFKRIPVKVLKSNLTSNALTYSVCVHMFLGFCFSNNNFILFFFNGLNPIWFVPWFTVVFVVKGLNMLKVLCAAGCTEKLHLFTIAGSGRDKLGSLLMETDAVTIFFK